jgi:phenylacetate-coenzyme A ligase PaaK-like adenylate-forming protein
MMRGGVNMIHSLGRVDRLLRSLAYDVLSLRDKRSGWRPHREAFLASLGRDRESLARDAEERLRKILVHAYNASPYYRDSWNAIGFHLTPSFTSNDLQQLPFLTKDILKEHKPSLVSERFRSDELGLSYTGGTTGTQTSFYLDHACTVSRMGRQWGLLELCGYRPGMRAALIWGVHDDLPAQSGRASFRQWFRRYGTSQETLGCADSDRRSYMDILALWPNLGVSSNSGVLSPSGSTRSLRPQST